MGYGMNDGPLSEGWSKVASAVAVLALIAVSCFVFRYDAMGMFGIGPEDVVPGMWVMLALLISVAAIPILNAFLESWRIDSLEVVLMTVLAFASVGFFIGFVFGYFYQIDEYPLWQHTMLIMLGLGAAVSAACLIVPDRRFDAEKGFSMVTDYNYPRLNSIYDGLCRKAGVRERPPLYVGNWDSFNAFAFGKYRSRQGTVVLEPLLRMLDDDEIEGVLGHELSHLLHHDIAVTTVTSTCARALTAFSVVMGIAALASSFILGAGGSTSSKNSGGGFVYLFMLVILLPVIIVGAVLWASVSLAMIAMAPGMSRSREYGADEGSAMITGKPMALASALRKLEHANRVSGTSLKPGVTTDQMIGDPFVGTRMRLKERLLSTHPSTDDRIRRLEALEKKLHG